MGLAYVMSLPAQTSEDRFRTSLKDVLSGIQEHYGIRIAYDEQDVKDKWVDYGPWRYRGDGEHALARVLAMFDLDAEKDASGTYQVRSFQYHERTPEEGVSDLHRLEGLYADRGAWEKRKAELQQAFRARLGLSGFPKRPASAPRLTALRKYKDYTVQNFSLETLPGVFICGSIYRPTKVKGRIPVVFNPDGHFDSARYRVDGQLRAANLARMGMLSVSYDLFGWWGESELQVMRHTHFRSHVQPLQVHNATMLFDWILSLPEADTSRVAITGASGGGSQTMLMTALDDRIKVSVPVVMMSSFFAGGCPCESGMGIHLCAGGTNNVEIAAMAAPRPQLVISDGQDWTRLVPVNDMPFLRRTYGFYGAQSGVRDVHFGNEGHDYGMSKRQAMYAFLDEQFGLKGAGLRNGEGIYPETGVVIEPHDNLRAFGPGGKDLPANALHGWEGIEKLVRTYMGE